LFVAVVGGAECRRRRIRAWSRHARRIRARAKQKQQTTAREQGESRRDVKGQLQGEITGIAKHVAGIAVKGGVDVSKIEKRLEGTFSVDVGGIEVEVDG
jgi:hypothetical protein